MLSFSWMLELETGVWAEGTTIVVSSSNDPGNMRRSALILRFCLEEFRANPNPSMHAGVSWSNCRYCAELHHAGGLILIGAAGQKMLPRGRGWWCGTAWPWEWLTSTLHCRMLKLRGGLECGSPGRNTNPLGFEERKATVRCLPICYEICLRNNGETKGTCTAVFVCISFLSNVTEFSWVPITSGYS